MFPVCVLGLEKRERSSISIERAGKVIGDDNVSFASAELLSVLNFA